MESARLDVFFSCSSKPEDKDINDHFRAICNSLDIKCTTVDSAHSSVPPEVARSQISESQGLIAVAPKRNKLENGDYVMPSSVLEEISIAYGQTTPILIFVEEGVELDGMKGNFCTVQKFSRDQLFSASTLEKTIKSIHRFKLEILSPNDLDFEPESNEIVAEHVQQLIELKKEGNEYIWSYSTNKKISFQGTFKRHIPVAFWAPIPVAPEDANTTIHADIKLEDHSRDLSLRVETIKETADYSKSLIKIEPHPEKGDFIEYSTFIESKYFNPVFFDEIKERNPIELNGKNYECLDGFVPIQRTKHATLEFRLPRGFDVSRSDITLVVGSYTDEIDYLVESEIKRAKVEYSDIGGRLTARMEIESPLLRHMYAFAWNPPKRLTGPGTPNN